MNILLLDIDSIIPNIALGKLSTYYKAKGDNVHYTSLQLKNWKIQKTSFCTNDFFPLMYDKIYISNIFTKNQNLIPNYTNAKNVELGGIGSKNPFNKLPNEIDECPVDYSLWPDCKTARGFLTRGCIRKCKWCFVPKYEGKLRKDKSIEFIKQDMETISFLDNNILAYKGHKKILQELIDKKYQVEFNQGLDIRLIDDENAQLISKLRYRHISDKGQHTNTPSMRTFAFDDIVHKEIIQKKYNIVKRYLPDFKCRFYVYFHPDNSLTDFLYRIEWCQKNKVYAYVMLDMEFHYIKYTKPAIYNFIQKIKSWCNQPLLFKLYSTFEEYATNALDYTKTINSQKNLRSAITMYKELKKQIHL